MASVVHSAFMCKLPMHVHVCVEGGQEGGGLPSCRPLCQSCVVCDSSCVALRSVDQFCPQLGACISILFVCLLA